MTSSDRSSILAVSTEYRFKKTQIFTFKILKKPQDFLIKHYIYIRIVKYIFSDLRFLRLFLDFRSETRMLG